MMMETMGIALVVEIPSQTATAIMTLLMMKLVTTYVILANEIGDQNEHKRY